MIVVDEIGAEHRVRVYLTYSNEGRTPYKWRGECRCGWTCLSWQWVAIDRRGGALPMAVIHVTEHEVEEQVLDYFYVPGRYEDEALMLAQQQLV